MKHLLVALLAFPFITLGQAEDKKFDLNIDEVKFILAKLAQVEFKGVEIEFTYNLIVKLQEHFKYLSKTQ